MESMPLSGQHAARAFWFFLQKQKERKTVPFREHFTCFFKSRTKGAGAPPPTEKARCAAFLPPAADILVAAATITPLRGISRRQSRLTDDKTPQSRLKKELYS